MPILILPLQIQSLSPLLLIFGFGTVKNMIWLWETKVTKTVVRGGKRA